MANNNDKKVKNENANNKQKKKYKLQVMDIITIVFTAVILGIMGFVIYDHFADDTVNPVVPNQSQSPSSASPTKEPALSDIGNIYGNITNDANVVLIDDREYFISADNNGDKHIYVTTNNVTKDLIKTDASCLNVVTDYVTYAGQTSILPYYVFYINGEGKICYYYDYTGSDGVVDEKLFSENVFLDGSYVTIDVSGEFVYHLNSEGVIAKTDIIKKTTEVLSSEQSYKDFVLYYGTIFALSDDNKIYRMASTVEASDQLSDGNATATPTATPTATATATPEPAPKEVLTVSDNVVSFAIDNDWIYTVSENGIARYLTDGNNARDTLSDVKAQSINVYNDMIFYYADGQVYTANASELLSGTTKKVGVEISSTKGINISKDGIYVVNENGKLCKTSYDSETKEYTAFKEMN